MRRGAAQVLVLVALWSCSCAAQGGLRLTEVQTRYGLCDASAAVAIDADRFLVASDEDNVLRLFRRDEADGPLEEFAMDAFLRPDPSSPEADIEGATAIGSRLYWITSHGRNKDGKYRASRYRFWAVDVERKPDRVELKPAGQPCEGLLAALCAAPQLAQYQLAAAAALAPKQRGALNIEGLAATPDKKLLIGFRNPLREGKALVVPLENPDEVIGGGAAKLGEPIELDLGGLGIRGMEYWPQHKQYVVIGGAIEAEAASRVFWWTGEAGSAAAAWEDFDWGDFNPESLIIYPDDSRRVQFVSDDGARRSGGVDCKKLADAAQRTFRTAWVEP